MSDNRIAELLRQEERELVTELDRQLANNPTYRKLKKVRALLDEYKPARQEGSGATNALLAHVTNVVLDAAEKVVRQGGGKPVRTSEIYEVLQSQGVRIPGKEPRNTLSARLSNSDRFVSNGRQGWTMADSSAGVHAEKAEAADEDESSTASFELGLASQGTTGLSSNGHKSPYEG